IVVGGLTLFSVGIANPAYSDSYLYSGGSYSTLSVPDAGTTNAFGINDLGQVVGGYSSHGFIYSNGSYTTFDVPGATATTLLGINDLGQMVGRYATGPGGSGNPTNFLYSGGTYTTISVPQAPNDTFAFGLNNLGQVVGTYVVTGAEYGFLYSNG